jgi:hypothetical protein
MHLFRESSLLADLCEPEQVFMMRRDGDALDSGEGGYARDKPFLNLFPYGNFQRRILKPTLLRQYPTRYTDLALPVFPRVSCFC